MICPAWLARLTEVTNGRARFAMGALGSGRISCIVALALTDSSVLVEVAVDGRQARHLFAEHAHAMAYVDVRLPNGDRGIGSAFHVGEGVFVTARHVVENNSIVEVKITESLGILARDRLRLDLGREPTEEEIERENALYSLNGTVPRFTYYHPPLCISEGPYFSSSSDLDVAVFRVNNVHPATGVVRLGVHFDDWIGRNQWQMSEAVVLGYPPIPMVNQPVLVAAKAEIHTFVQPRHTRFVHFILSATPRGGFSGGAVIHESGDALGLVTSSLIEGSNPPELGFFAVLSIEGICQCLAEHSLYPETQREYHRLVLGIDPAPVLSGVFRPQLEGGELEVGSIEPKL